jgi:hypothetical protein
MVRRNSQRECLYASVPFEFPRQVSLVTHGYHALFVPCHTGINSRRDAAHADLEAVGQGLEDPHHLVDGADLGGASDLPGLAEDADRDALVVDIEPDREQGCLLKSLYLGDTATDFQVTRVTEASFIISTPTCYRGLRLAQRWPGRLECRRTHPQAEQASPSDCERARVAYKGHHIKRF